MRNVGLESNVQNSGGIKIGGTDSGSLVVVKKDQTGDTKPVVSGDVYVGPHSTPPEAPSKIQQVATPAGEKNAVAFKSDQAILLFNGDCPVCTKIASWVIAQDDPKNGGSQRLDERPIGFDPEALKKLNPELTIWDAYSTIHVIMPDGSMKTGGEAIAEVFRRLPETRWATGVLDLNLFGWRPFQSMLNAGYTVLDKLRPALGCTSCGTPVPWWGKPIEWGFKLYKKIFPDPAPVAEKPAEK